MIKGNIHFVYDIGMMIRHELVLVWSILSLPKYMYIITILINWSSSSQLLILFYQCIL